MLPINCQFHAAHKVLDEMFQRVVPGHAFAIQTCALLKVFVVFHHLLSIYICCCSLLPWIESVSLQFLGSHHYVFCYSTLSYFPLLPIKSTKVVAYPSIHRSHATLVSLSSSTPVGVIHHRWLHVHELHIGVGHRHQSRTEEQFVKVRHHHHQHL